MAKTAKQTTKDRMNRAISKIVAGYHETQCVPEIFSAIKANGGLPVQEDNTEWEGMLMGDDSQCIICIMHPDYKPAPSLEYPFYLNLSWHKMQSGKWEIVAYIA